MTPRDGEAVAEIVGVETGETMTDWVPAVLPLEHTTTTVYVPGLTFDQPADWRELDPVSAAWRPCEKFTWLLLRSEALPKLPLIRVHALVVTETVDPLVLTEMPGPADACPAIRVSGSAAAAAAVRPVRRSG
jgi:hypothetical protein